MPLVVKNCLFCGGDGRVALRTGQRQCVACGGRGSLKVKAPPIKCDGCQNGKVGWRMCKKCRGCGWKI